MKKRTKAVLSGILILGILFSTPTCMESAEAAGQKAVNRERMAVFRWDLTPRDPGWEGALEVVSDIQSEDCSEDISDISSENTSQEESEIISEGYSEIFSEDLSEGASEDRSEIFPESISEGVSETESELILEEITEIITEVEENTGDGNAASDPARTETMPACDIAVEVSDGGELDYRTYMDKDAELRIIVREPETVEPETVEAAPEDDGNGSDGSYIGDKAPFQQPTDVRCKVTINNTGIVDFAETDGTVKYHKASGTLTMSGSSIPLRVRSVGRTKYTVEVSAGNGLGTVSLSGSIRVNHSPLYDSDFYIELSRNGQAEQFGYDAWITYLENCREWMSGQVEVKLTDTGKKYYDSIKMRTQKVTGSPGNTANKAMKKYTFWAEHSDRRVSTKGVENGTRSFTAGIDTDAPVLSSFCVESKCYEPTKTETEQYFAEDFVLRGSFDDDISGVIRIEYTTNFQSGQDTVWAEADTAQTDTMTDFRITLPDGCYPAIAVRAYDAAGNVSAVSGYTNDAGKYIKVVVDRTAPALSLRVTSEGLPYSGENDNWTNKDVRIDVTFDKEGCPYAGIDQCEYSYMKIGRDMTDVSEKWTRLSLQEDLSAALVITEDKNGCFLFRAVSKAGVRTKEDVKQRILIQHQAAGIKPIVVSGADEAKCRNGWYNKQSGAPVIRFEYPDYDTGVMSGEYDAPITIHYKLEKEAAAAEDTAQAGYEKSASIGVMSSEDSTVQADGSRKFVLTKDDLNQHIIDFRYGDGDMKEVQDGIYTLEYWTTDKAGNESEKHTYSYQIDCHEPTDLTMELGGSPLVVGGEPVITYERFYQDTVSGSAAAQYGISGKGSLKVMKAKKIGEWKDQESGSLEDADEISIYPNTRCFLYVRAEDQAGNAAEGWTNGIVVDNMAPNEADGVNNKELIIEPEGANRHGFFNDDIVIDIRVRDMPGDNNCAALKSVSGSIGRDGEDTVTDRELFSFTKESPTEDEMTAASDFQGTQLIDAKANESNEAYIEVTAVDRSDNVKTSTQLLKIDVTKPVIDISFDNNNAVNGSFYREGRVATVHVHELNLDPDAVNISVTQNGQPYEALISGWTSQGSDHYAEITFAEDGDYRITADCTDLADNISDEVQSEPFTIDCTAPEITIGIITDQDTGISGKESDKNCFNTGVTAVITVTEHNFREEDFVTNVATVPERMAWNHAGDVHTLHIPFEGDNTYHMDCAYTDMAGNIANTVEKDFVIDTAAPVIVIEGITDGSANSGAILPVISVLDRNLDAADISVSVVTGTGDTVETAIGTEWINDDNPAGCRLVLTDLTEKPDNIYYLTVSAADQAGNEAKLTYRFSLNRNGSVYDLTSLMQLMDRQYHTYSGISEIRIAEMNIDTIEEFELYVSRNGAIGYKAEYTKEISGSDAVGYTYIYKIKNENFAEEGTYRLSLYSRDRAGNEVNNVSDICGNEISFVVDNTAPKVVIDGVESGMMYDVEEQEVHISVTDNFKLAEAELTLVNKANEVLDRWDYMELAGENSKLDITIPQYHEAVSLLYRVKDAAGNEVQTFQGEQAALGDFLITTDRFVQFINKPARAPFSRIIIFMTVVSVVIVLIGKRKLKHL